MNFQMTQMNFQMWMVMRMIPQRGSSNCSGARTTYHNCSGGPKKCPLWPRFLRYPRQKKRFMAPVNTRGQKSYLLASPQYASVLKPRQNNKNNRGQKSYLLASPQYASVLKPRQNNKNNRGQKPILHWCIC